MGVLPAPAQNMYWFKDKLFHPSCIEMKFSRTRYENLMKYFHVADTSRNPPRGAPGHDKLAHVRPMRIRSWLHQLRLLDVGCIHSCMWSLFVQALAVHGPICHDQVLLEVDFWKCLQHENISSFYQPLPKTCTGSKTNCSIRRALK
jgi:hypothetical protein